MEQRKGPAHSAGPFVFRCREFQKCVARRRIGAGGGGWSICIIDAAASGLIEYSVVVSGRPESVRNVAPLFASRSATDASGMCVPYELLIVLMNSFANSV